MGNQNLEVIPVDNPELYRMEPSASTRWVKPRSLKNRGVLDHHFLEKVPNHTESRLNQSLTLETYCNLSRENQLNQSLEQICLVNKAGGVEVADVRNNLLKLRFFQAHPLSNWQHKILEGKLGNQTSTTSILFCSRKLVAFYLAYQNSFYLTFYLTFYLEFYPAYLLQKENSVGV